jgi:hypothetical protein
MRLVLALLINLLFCCGCMVTDLHAAYCYLAGFTCSVICLTVMFVGENKCS